MDNSKSIKFNLNKLLLKAISIVVIGTFLINTAFVDLAWARTDSFLRVPVDERIRKEIKDKLVVNSLPPGSPVTFFRILTSPAYKRKEVSLETLIEETKKLFKEGTKKAEVGLSVDTIERDIQILTNAGLVIIREKTGGKIMFKVNSKLADSKKKIRLVQKILDDEYQWGKIGRKTKKSERDRIAEKLKKAVSYREDEIEMVIGRGMYEALMEAELEGKYADYIKDMLGGFKVLRHEFRKLCRDEKAVISLSKSLNKFVEIIFEDIDKKPWVEYDMHEQVRSLVDSMLKLDVFNTVDKFELGLKYLEYLAGKIKEKGIEPAIVANITANTISTFARPIILADIFKVTKTITIEWLRLGIESVCRIADKTPESRDQELWYNLIAIVFEVANIYKTVEEFESGLQYLDDFLEKIKGMGIEIDNMFLSAIFEVPKISETVEEFESGLKYLEDFVVELKKEIYPEGKIDECITESEVKIFLRAIEAYEAIIYYGVPMVANIYKPVEEFGDGLKHLEDFVVKLKDKNLHEGFYYDAFVAVPRKLEDIGVYSRPILRYLINNKRISEIELLISLDVSGLSKLEYEEIIRTTIRIFENNIPEQIKLLAKFSKVVGIVQTIIPESKEVVLEQFKEWQANPSVSTLGSRVIELMNAGITPLPQLLSSNEPIGSLKEQIDSIRKGDFDSSNPIHIDLIYPILQEQIKVSDIKSKITYTRFLDFIHRAKAEEKADDFIRGLLFLAEYPDSFEIIFDINDSPDRIKRKGFTVEAIADLSVGIISSRHLSYINNLEDLFDIEIINEEKHDPFREFLVNRNINLRVRMQVCGDYMELVMIRELTKDTSIDEKIESVNRNISEINKGSLKMRQIERHQKDIVSKLIPVKKQLVKYLLDEEISDDKEKLFEDKETLKQILTIASIVATTKFREKIILGNCFKGYLKELFLNFDPANPDGIKRAKEKAQKWVIGIDKQVLKELGQEKEFSNKETIEHLCDKGYEKELFTEGIEIKHSSSRGITGEKKRRMILSATYEMVVDIAIKSGVTEIDGKPLIADYAANLDTYSKAKEFYELVKKSGVLSEEEDARMIDILDMVKRTDELVIKGVKEAEFRITINGGFLPEASAGIGVPGCFSPNGEYREMPPVHALEANVFFMQIFNGANRQVGNAVVILADEGAFVYSGYNFSSYDLEPLYAESLKELSKKVPAIFMTESSAGFSEMKKYAEEVRNVELKKPATIFEDQYFDWGVIDEQGALSLKFAKLYKITQASIEAKGGFERAVKLKPQIPAIDWKGLLNQLRERNLTKYSFMIAVLQKKMNGEGKVIIDESFNEWIKEEIRTRFKGTLDTGEIGDVASILGEFLQGKLRSVDGRDVKAGRYSYINIKFNQEKIDKEHPIVLVVHPNLLFDNPSLALAIQNLKEQLGENVMVVLPYDKSERVADFCEDINKLTDGLTNLRGDDFVIVDADAKPEKVIEIVKESLAQKGLKAEGMKLKVIGPRNWAEPYQEVSGIQELIIVISEVGEGNSISRGDIAILSALVDEGLLNKEDKDRLLKEVIMSKDRKVIVVKLEEVEKKAKEAEDIEAFRKVFEEYK